MKHNDLDVENWKDCNINTDSLQLINEHDKSGKHESEYPKQVIGKIRNLNVR